MLSEQIRAVVNHNEVSFLCSGCGALNMPANCAVNHVLLCPSCHRVLGIWPTSSERDCELKKLIDEMCSKESLQALCYQALPPSVQGNSFATCVGDLTSKNLFTTSVGLFASTKS